MRSKYDQSETFRRRYVFSYWIMSTKFEALQLFHESRLFHNVYYLLSFTSTLCFLHKVSPCSPVDQSLYVWYVPKFRLAFTLEKKQGTTIHFWTDLVQIWNFGSQFCFGSVYLTLHPPSYPAESLSGSRGCRPLLGKGRISLMYDLCIKKIKRKKSFL